jgi:hypothetical protein
MAFFDPFFLYMVPISALCSSEKSGIEIAPEACPLIYSLGLRTSMIGIVTIYKLGISLEVHIFVR